MFTLEKKQQIGRYMVAFPIKEGDYAETYRVKDADGKNYFLKLIDLSKLNAKQFDEDGNVIEVEIVNQLNHPNLMHFVESEELSIGGRQMVYLVCDFISGETLEEKYIHESGSNPYEVRNWLTDILAGLQYLQTLPDAIIHNELTPENVMYDAVNKRAVVIDFGHARRMSDGRRTFDRKGLSPYFLAPETAGGLYSPQSDLFTVGVTAYKLLYGHLPWQVGKGDDIEEQLQQQREQPLRVTTLSNVAAPEGMVETIAKALSVDAADRFNGSDEMSKALNGEIKVSARPIVKAERNGSEPRKSTPLKPKRKEMVEKVGKGFADVAGMQELKQIIKSEIIDVIQNPEESKKYGLSLPNGMLLYGPPGCGKTFFAKKMAEEAGFNFIEKTPSDLKSKWVNASQENIAQMFREAEENAPTVIFIDEINELLPRRDGDAHEMAVSAVNEMLAQMDRTGERGIFVIGATNLPSAIDEAMLRAGRLEKKYYIGPPDFEARKSLFEINLKDRFVDLGIDYDRLSQMTENYVSADIRLIVDDASRKAFKSKSKITMDLLCETIGNFKPTITADVLKRYESIKSEMENEPKHEPKHNPIGFRR